MVRCIVDTKQPITLFGGAKPLPDVVARAVRLAPFVVAADGGAKFALELGNPPQAVIGDFDSLNQASIAQIPPDRLHRIEEQNSTDFDKCLSHIKAPLILAVGFTGNRLDHELATLGTLLRFPDQRCVLLGEIDLCFLAPADLHLELPVGTRFSLFPMARCRVTATGLRWPVDGLEMAPDGAISISNEVADTCVRLQVSAPKMLVILPTECLTTAIRALTNFGG